MSLHVRLHSIPARIVLVMTLAVPAHAAPQGAGNSTHPDDAKSGAASTAGDKHPGDVTVMAPREFDAWADAESAKSEAAREAPVGLESGLLKRLRAGQYVTDEAELSAVRAWMGCESRRLVDSGQAGRPGSHFPQTMRVMDELDAFMYGRTFLKAAIDREKGELFKIDQDRENEAKEREVVAQLLTPLQDTIDEWRMEAVVCLAEDRYAMGDKPRAEAGFLNALSFDWGPWSDAVALHAFIDLYVRAGRALIQCRRGNLAALRDIHFLGAASGELDPALKEAIDAALDRAPAGK